MSGTVNREAGSPVVGGYSDLAAAYDAPENLESCWGRSTSEALSRITLAPWCRLVADVGCGTGHELVKLATNTAPGVQFVGIEPAPRMRERAAARTGHLPNVKVIDGAFEDLPLTTASVDHLYSIYAFHWTTDPERAALEVRRVLDFDGALDLIFVGSENGPEFSRVTTPIVRRYMGRSYMRHAGSMQRQISKEAALQLFRPLFPEDRLSVEESFETCWDTLEGHWAWRVRIEGHFRGIPADRRALFDAEVRDALASLATDRGIPYTIHQLHVKVIAAQV